MHIAAIMLVVAAGTAPPKAPAAGAAADPSAKDVLQAMRRAADFFASTSVHGGYAGIYSLDLRHRWGESLYERAGKNQIWIQPPGTPSVGETFLRCWRATGQRRYFLLARRAAWALAWAQRAAGGWDHLADLSAVRDDADHPVPRKGPCTLDDRISQGALDFLMSFDQVAEEPWLGESVRLGLKYMLAAQRPNGGWPQWYPLRGGYHDYYTFNDGTINDCINVMLRAWRLYGRKDLLESALRGGQFIILSQLPDPQAGWAQQYDRDLKPAKARSFEPAGACSAVTSRNIRTLVTLYRLTGRKKYLAPIPRAIAWLKRSDLGGGRWARLYELHTNRPIYGDRDGKVHYSLDEISQERRTGYCWQGDYGIPAAIRLYQRAAAEGPRPPAGQAAAR
ncbi:MAG: hypothetical protein J7M21_05295 [Planctomycetes bacterium]|nr:hypothetical protein [Planctomycetota bacterium]